ncbi:MAG: hypothetical protein ACI8XV_001361 [Arenicella sp.]|jgi:hypothetical protein
MADENKVTTAPAKAVVTAPANVTVVTAPAKKAAAAPAKKAAAAPAKKAAAAPAKKVAAKKTTKKVAAKPVAKVVKKAAKKTTASKPAKTVAENKLEQLQDLLQENLSGLNTDKAEAVAKNIWLAGLGAYSRSLNEFSERRDDIQSRVVTINSEGQKVFEDLVERGQAMQGEAEKAMKQGRETIEERVEEFKERFGGGLSSFVDIPTRLREAAEKIEEISDRFGKKK